MLRGGIRMTIGNFPGNSESTNLSRHNLSRDTCVVSCLFVHLGVV